MPDDPSILVIGGGALVAVGVLWAIAEVALRRPKSRARREQARRIKAWERAELERVGPDVFYGPGPCRRAID